MCLGKLLPVMDKWMFLDSLLPMLALVPSREAGVLMAILGIFHEAMKEHDKYGLDHTVLAAKVRFERVKLVRVDSNHTVTNSSPLHQVIPYLSPLSVEASLNASQFAKFMSLLRRMLDHVENVHAKSLKDLERMKDESATLEFRAGKLSSSGLDSSDPTLQKMEKVC